MKSNFILHLRNGENNTFIPIKSKQQYSKLISSAVESVMDEITIYKWDSAVKGYRDIYHICNRKVGFC